ASTCAEARLPTEPRRFSFLGQLIRGKLQETVRAANAGAQVRQPRGGWCVYRAMQPIFTHAMPTGFACPNPTCSHTFPDAAVKGATALKCPKCGSLFQFRPGPSPAKQPGRTPQAPARVEAPKGGWLSAPVAAPPAGPAPAWVPAPPAPPAP